MRIPLLLMLVIVVGCSSESTKKEEAMTLDKVPETVMKAAEEARRTHFPDLEFQKASRRKNGVYEITGKTKSGKIHDVEVNEAGEVVEVE